MSCSFLQLSELFSKIRFFSFQSEDNSICESRNNLMFKKCFYLMVWLGFWHSHGPAVPSNPGGLAGPGRSGVQQSRTPLTYLPLFSALKCQVGGVSWIQYKNQFQQPSPLTDWTRLTCMQKQSVPECACKGQDEDCDEDEKHCLYRASKHSFVAT